MEEWVKFPGLGRGGLKSLGLFLFWGDQHPTICHVS